MTKIIVDFNELKKYSNNINDDAQQFDIITKNMEEIINSLKRRGWSGYDADAFISNAVKYLEDLVVVKEALLESAQIVQDRNQKYSKKVQEYFDRIKVRSELDER